MDGKFAWSIIVNSQGKIKENFSSSECPIFGKRPYYCLYSLAESNRGEYVCKLTPRIQDLMPSRPPLSFLLMDDIIYVIHELSRQSNGTHSLTPF